MQIWVDADACPVAIKEILYKAAERLKLQLTLVANCQLNTPPSSYINSIRVAPGPDVADNEIVSRIAPGDLVITADIPLASAVIDKNAHALNPRGELYCVDNIKERLDMRDFMDNLRGCGIETGGPAPLNKSDRQEFANQLDKFLTARR